MAEKRMFTKKITQSDEFIAMPHSSQNLYWHLNMEADDEGFVNSPKRVIRMIGASEDDIKILLAKRFLIGFESGVIVIKHWKMHNVIRSERLKNTSHVEERSRLSVKENGSYTESKTISLQDVSQVSDKCQTNVSIEEIRLDEISLEEISVGKKSSRFAPPSQEEVKEYMCEIGASDDSQRFIDYYTSNGWMVGRNKMKDWKATVRNWVSRNKSERKGTKTGSRFLDLMEDENEQN